MASANYDYRPTLLFVGDPERELPVRTAAHAAGFRICGSVSPSDALKRLNEQALVDAVWVDADEFSSADSLALLARLQQGARENAFGSVICTSFSIIDMIASFWEERLVQIACNPTLEEAATALRLASARPARAQAMATRVSDSTGGSRLVTLSEDVRNIAAALNDVADRTASLHQRQREAAGSLTAENIRGLIKARRLRDEYFAPTLFADPAWDMILDLLAARMEDKLVSVSSLCIAAAVPATTALRWISKLIKLGLFVKIADPHDHRRHFIKLSDQLAERCESYFSTVLPKDKLFVN